MTYPAKGRRPGVSGETLPPHDTGASTSHEVGVVAATIATQVAETVRLCQWQVGEQRRKVV